MRTGKASVHVAGAGVVHSVKVEEQPLAGLERRHVERAPIPQQLVRLELASHAREQSLRREGHADALGELRRYGSRALRRGPAGVGGKRALPPAVEAPPRVAAKLGMRMGDRRRCVFTVGTQPLSPRCPEGQRVLPLVRSEPARKHAPDVHDLTVPCWLRALYLRRV